MLSFLVVSLVFQRDWSNPSPLCVLKDKSLSESSGVAASRLYDGAFFTHNDSGDKPRFFRFTKTGIDATFNLVGAKSLDWEDMASVRLKGRNWLYFGDIGDNGSKRKNITVYRLEEPKGNGRELTKFDTYTLTYPDGPHNCETLFVDPNSGDIHFVTKTEGLSSVYKLKAPSKSGSYNLLKMGQVKPDTGLGKYGQLVTAGDADPSGKHVVLRTYSGALEYTVKGRFQDWWKSVPRPVKMPFVAQSEAICYSKNGLELVTTSEGSPCPIHSLSMQE